MSENEKRRRVPIWLIIAVVLGILLMLGLASDIKETYTKSQNYNKAIELIEQGEYVKAGILLRDFYLGDDYKDGRYLYSYAYYLKYKDENAYEAHRCLKEIPETYRGKFADEIAAERPLCEAAYAEYEKNREAENERKYQEHKNNVPATTQPPAVTTKPPVTTTKKKKKKKEEPKYPYDEFDVYDYYDEEDFYYDHEDDFWDFEDAEDYFNEAWDKVK